MRYSKMVFSISQGREAVVELFFLQLGAKANSLSGLGEAFLVI